MTKTPSETTTPRRTEESWHQRVEMLLAICAKQAKLITYDELAQASDIPSPHRIHKLTKLLEDLTSADIAQDAPLRACVVISKIRGIPAPGFFAHARACGASYKEGEERPYHRALLQQLNPDF